MSNMLTSSIGKKFIMSITGLFLVCFLLVHLTMNAMLLFGEETFNEAAHFMQNNPIMKVLEPILGVGFIIHIIYSSYITLRNQGARPVKYKKIDRTKSTTWPSRNMYILGFLVLIFLVIHLMNYFYKIKFGDMEGMNDYTLVTTLFSKWYYVVIYLLGFIFLGLHLNHAFQSAFHTLGWNSLIWMPRLKVISSLYAIVVAVGFSVIALYFFIIEFIK